jgi:hypothetical protein
MPAVVEADLSTVTREFAAKLVKIMAGIRIADLLRGGQVAW